MKKKSGFARCMVVGFLVLLAFTGGCGSPAATGDEETSSSSGTTISLNLGHFFPATHPVETEFVQKWIEAIDEATEGAVKIESYPGETLVNASETYESVVSGIADIGLSCFSYTRGRFPVLEAFELPGITYYNSKSASKVAWEGIKELNPDEIQDTKLLMVFATGPGDLFTRVPVHNLDDLRNLEIRATGLSAQTLQALGATPVGMSQPETYEALSRGIVEGNLAPVEVLQGWRHAEVTDYITQTPFLYNTLFFVTMNLDKWNSLPPEIQSTIEEVSEQIHESIAKGLWDLQNQSALHWAVEETGQEIITLSETETERWIERVMPLQDDFIKKMEEKGLPGADIMERVNTLADQYNETYH